MAYVIKYDTRNSQGCTFDLPGPAASVAWTGEHFLLAKCSRAHVNDVPVPTGYPCGHGARRRNKVPEIDLLGKVKDVDVSIQDLLGGKVCVDVLS